MIVNQINEIVANAAKAKTPFAETYIKLKNLDLISYTVDVATLTTTYELEEREFTIKKLEKLNISGVFSSEDIKQSIDYHNKYLTSYKDFINDLAHHGCYSYTVDFIKDQVIYYNQDKSKQHIEPIKLPEKKLKPTYLSKELKEILSKPSALYFFPIIGTIIFMKDLFALQEEAGLFDGETPGGTYLNETTKKWMSYLSVLLPIIIFVSSILFNFLFFAWRGVTKKAIKLNENALVYKDFGSF